MFTAEQFARVRALICKDCEYCEFCPLSNNQPIPNCIDFQIKYPAEAVKRIELWWMENKKDYPEYQREVER